jgi:nitrate reductase NapD
MSTPVPFLSGAAEIHIAGVLIHVRPEHADDVCVAISLLPDAEVSHRTADGRIVAVLEAGSARGVVQQLDGVRALRGVLNVAVVYQHAEAEDEMNKEMTV